MQDSQLPEDSVTELACDLVRALQYVASLNFPLFLAQFSCITLICTKIGYHIQVFTFKWNNLL